MKDAKHGHLHKIKDDLIWPFKKGEIQEPLARIGGYATFFTLALQNYNLCDPSSPTL
jgi:hypothetical protein